MWWLLALPLAALGVVVVLLAIVTALVAAAGITVPWLLFGVIIWAVFAAHRGGRRHGLPRYAPPRHTAQPPAASPRRMFRPTSPEPRSRTVAQRGSPLPIDVQVKVDQIKRKVDVLLAYAPHFAPFSSDLHIVRQTTADYLPRTIQAYLALPASSRDDVSSGSGKTALQELKEQLDLLDAKLNSIAEDLERRNLDELAANRRFLEERFGRSRS